MRITGRRLAALGATVVIAGGSLLAVQTASASSDSNPQLRPAAGVQADAATPDRCVLRSQSGIAGSYVGKTYNNDTTITTVNTWVRAKCADVVVNVNRGEKAILELEHSGEFDAAELNPTTGQPVASSTGWVQGRFRVGGVSGGAVVGSIEPLNDGRVDSFALDSAKGGLSDWSAHTLQQNTTVECPTSAPSTGCNVLLWVEYNLTSGTNYFWYDDITTEVKEYDQTYYGLVRSELDSTP